MRYAEVDSKGKFTGAVYEEATERIIADRASYGNTLVAVDRTITDKNAAGSIKPDFGEPTSVELARPVRTVTGTLADLAAAIVAVEVRLKKLEDKATL